MSQITSKLSFLHSASLQFCMQFCTVINGQRFKKNQFKFTSTKYSYKL